MDEKDRKILEILIKDARAKLKGIARKTGLPITTVYNRIKKMENEGIFEAKANLNLKKMGYGITFYVLASVDTSAKNIDQEELAKKIAAMKNILEADVITGSRDILIKAVARDVDEMSDLVLKRIRSAGGIASTETLVVLKEVKGGMEKFLR